MRPPGEPGGVPGLVLVRDALTPEAQSWLLRAIRAERLLDLDAEDDAGTLEAEAADSGASSGRPPRRNQSMRFAPLPAWASELARRVRDLAERPEEEQLDELSEEELEAYEEELEEVIEEFVEELETEELVVVVEQIAEVGVENLAVADEQTIKVVQAVVAEVVDTETVEELSEEEVEAVAEVLGFEEEEDVAIIAEVAAKDENVAEAVSEYVERAVDNADTENYTLADVVTEVQVEVFLENPVGTLLDVNIGEMDLGSIGSDMTSDQKEKAQEVVVPIIIASQIVAQAGALITRRF